MPLWKILVPLALALVTLPASSGAARAPGDGTLSVKDGRATIQLAVRGGLIGRFTRGKLTVIDPIAEDGTVTVRGAEKIRDVSDTTTVYSGTDVRFRVIGGKFGVKVHARGIQLSAVGRGRGTLNGWGDPDEGIFFDGVYSLNGDDYRSIPDEPTKFELAAPAGG